MKIVQVYNTYKGENYKMGYPTFNSMLNDWNESLAIHLENYDVVIYTDVEGAAKLEGKINPNATIEIIEFPTFDDRFWNLGKLYIHTLQNSSYIYLDIDATLHEVISVIDVDIICEMFRGGALGKYLGTFKLKLIDLSKVRGIACSGLLGFKDANVAKQYAELAIEKIRNCELKSVEFEALWHVEEVSLSNFIADNNLTTKEFLNFTHKQGGEKR